MLRLINVGTGMPISYPVDPTASFESGMLAQLKVIGNDIVSGVSDGTAPMGMIDDVNSASFTARSIDEIVTVNTAAVSDGYQLVAAVDTKQELRFSNIIRNSFVSDVEGIVLNEVNGVVTVPAGTALNHDDNGDGILDSVRMIVNYIYRIPNIPGDNTTLGSGRMTIWIDRGIYETDQFDPTQKYAVNATLFANSEGLFTTKQENANNPGIAMVSGPPTGIVNTLEFLFF